MKAFSTIGAVVAFLAFSGLTLAAELPNHGPVAVSRPAPPGGPCTRTPHGPTCPQGQYCSFAGLECAYGGPGRCQLKPQVCAAVHNPVCGCDGKYYANACEAHRAGVSVGLNTFCPRVSPEARQ
jgi:hypothetical protein